MYVVDQVVSNGTKAWTLTGIMRTWFLKIDPVQIVGMRACMCVCVPVPKAINN